MLTETPFGPHSAGYDWIDVFATAPLRRSARLWPMTDIRPEDRVLDWHPRKDPRSLRYQVADHFATDKPLRSRWRVQYQYLDQGREGACTGFAAAKALGQTPDRVRTVSETLAKGLYYEARRQDEWPGEDYEGSSILGVMKAAQIQGFISAYYWATSLKQMQHAVCHLGPLVIGINWYEAMFYPDADGFIRPEGDWMGGHALCVGAVNLKLQAFVLHNSWGRSWGGQGPAPEGSALLSFADAERLVIAERGEAALMKKTRS